MNESMPDSVAPERMLQRLRDLRRGLLRLHKLLLDDERAAYEALHGRVSGGQLLQLVINDEQFAWLHAVSEFIVRIDELFDADEPATARDAEALVVQARALLKASETGNEFERRYYAVLQREPDAVIAHGEVARLLAADN